MVHFTPICLYIISYLQTCSTGNIKTRANNNNKIVSGFWNCAILRSGAQRASLYRVDKTTPESESHMLGIFLCAYFLAHLSQRLKVSICDHWLVADVCQHRGSTMSAYFLLNSNKFGKSDKMLGLPIILSHFRIKFNRFNNTGIRMLDSFYHMTLNDFAIIKISFWA